MKPRSVLRTICVTLLLSGSLGLALNTVVVDYAYAKNGGGNGGGGESAGNGGDRGNSGNSNRGGKAKGKNNGTDKGKGNSKQKDTSVGASLKKLFGIKSKEQQKAEMPAKPTQRKVTSKPRSKLERVGKKATDVSMRPPAKGTRPKQRKGLIASELKGLNAAKANINGLMNAAPDSMPGMLNTYRTAALLEAEKMVAVNAAVLAVEDAKTNDLQSQSDLSMANETVLLAEAALIGVTPEDENFAMLTQALAEAQAEQAEAQASANASGTELAAAQAVETAALEEAKAAAEAAQGAFTALPGAADLSEPALQELKSLLGLDDPIISGSDAEEQAQLRGDLTGNDAASDDVF